MSSYSVFCWRSGLIDFITVASLNLLTEILYSPIFNCREGSNKLKWVEKGDALEDYFLNSD